MKFQRRYNSFNLFDCQIPMTIACDVQLQMCTTKTQSETAANVIKLVNPFSGKSYFIKLTKYKVPLQNAVRINGFTNVYDIDTSGQFHETYLLP